MMKLLLFILFIGITTAVTPQGNNLNQSRGDEPKQNSPAFSVFNEIESGFSSRNINSIAKYLSPQTYFSFSNGVAGYYSSNQAFYVLEDFLKINPVVSFRLQNVQAEENSAYATGVYVCENKGKRISSQVYLSLVKTGHNWKINQITIN